MLNVDETGDYRDLLKQFYVQRKQEMQLYSYKMMGSKLGLETSQLFRILNKSMHLPTRCIPLVKDLLGLTGRSAELFEILVAAARTKSTGKQKKLYDMALNLRDVELRRLSNYELKFLSKWWIPVVRSCIELNHGKCVPEHIAAQIQPPITKEQVIEAIQTLVELGLIVKKASGIYTIHSVNFTTTGTDRIQAIRDYQGQLFSLGQNALSTIPPNERNITSLMVSVDEECFQDLQEMSKEFRRQIQKRVEEVKSSNRIMEIMVSIFPLTKKND